MTSPRISPDTGKILTQEELVEVIYNVMDHSDSNRHT